MLSTKITKIIFGLGAAVLLISAPSSSIAATTAEKAAIETLKQQEKQETTGEYLDDSGLTAKVKAKILGQKGLDSLDIKVITVRGAVTLMGEVDTDHEFQLAEKVALEVEGVKSVTNQLVVKK